MNDTYELPCPDCKRVTLWVLLTRIGKQSTYRCSICDRLKTWTARW